jgi:hypothetical protein
MVVLWSGVAFVMGCRGGAGSVEQQILRFAKDDKKWVFRFAEDDKEAIDRAYSPRRVVARNLV